MVCPHTCCLPMSSPIMTHSVVMERELGRPVNRVYSQISPEPVAAASLGQVYRARLASDGREVAVKVNI